MLTQMRSFTRSWVSYVLLFILAALFVLFLGNGQSLLDTLQYQGANYVAKGNGFVITPPQLARELDLTLRSQRNQGQDISQAQAIEAGVHRQLLDGMVGRNAMRVYAERLGISASNVQVAERIRSIPAVLNPVSGAFDEESYQRFLGELRYTQTEFENDVRGDLTTQMLLEALLAGARAPSSFGAMALTYGSETRVVSIAEAPGQAIGAIPAPTQEQLQQLYEESQEQFRIPEYRALTLAYARPRDFLSRVSVPEERLSEELESRRAALTQPERRTYVRITAQSEPQANDAAARLARGEAPNAVAAALGVQVTRGENQSRTEVPDARVAEAVFSTQARSAPRVVRGQLTPWAVVRVESVTAPVQPNLTAVREELRQAIALDEAGELLNDAVAVFEDARGGGASLADAARQAGLTVVAIAAVDAHGHDQSDAQVQAFVGNEDLVEAAFETSEGESSDFLPAGDADVVIGVDRIIPSSIRPLEEVRVQLAQAWVIRERGRRLRELGANVVEAVRGGQSFSAAARAQRFTMVVSSRPLDREAASQIPARGLPAQVFAAREGDVLSDVRVDGGSALVAIVERIDRVDPGEQPQEVEANRQRMQQSLSASFAQAVQGQVVSSVRADRNERLLDQLYPSGAEQSDEGQ